MNHQSVVSLQGFKAAIQHVGRDVQGVSGEVVVPGYKHQWRAIYWDFSSENNILMHFFSTIMSSNWVMLIWIVQVRANLPPGGPHQLKRPTILQGIGSNYYDLGWPNHTSDFCGTKTASDMKCRSIGTDGVGSPAIWSREVLPKGSCLFLGTGSWKTKLLRHWRLPICASDHYIIIWPHPNTTSTRCVFPGKLLLRVGGGKKKVRSLSMQQCSGHNFNCCGTISAWALLISFAWSCYRLRPLALWNIEICRDENSDHLSFDVKEVLRVRGVRLLHHGSNKYLS